MTDEYSVELLRNIRELLEQNRDLLISINRRVGDIEKYRLESVVQLLDDIKTNIGDLLLRDPPR